jgi:hypothetical protein
MHQQKLTGSTGASTTTLISTSKSGFGRQSAHNVSHDLETKLKSQASKQKLNSSSQKRTAISSGSSVPKTFTPSSSSSMPLKVI